MTPDLTKIHFSTSTEDWAQQHRRIIVYAEIEIPRGMLQFEDRSRLRSKLADLAQDVMVAVDYNAPPPERKNK